MAETGRSRPDGSVQTDGRLTAYGGKTFVKCDKQTERCRSGLTGRSRKPLCCKAPRVRIPASPPFPQGNGPELVEGPSMKKEPLVWFVYMLRCRDGSYYVGIATDVRQRVKQHNKGQGCVYTKRRRPVELVYAEKQEDYASARGREAQLKGWRREKKEWLIHGFPSTRPSDSLRT
jgi:putative endonuclease